MNSDPLLPSNLHNLEQLMQDFCHQVKLTNIYFKTLEVCMQCRVSENLMQLVEMYSITLEQLIEVSGHGHRHCGF